MKSNPGKEIKKKQVIFHNNDSTNTGYMNMEYMLMEQGFGCGRGHAGHVANPAVLPAHG